MLTLLSKYWKPIVGAFLVVILLGGSYLMGSSNTANKYELRIAEMLRASAEDHAKTLAIVRGRELALQEEVKRVDQQGIENVEKVRTSMQSTIDGLESGTLKLRQRLAAVEITNRNRSTSPTPGVGGSGSVETIGLRGDDAKFLIRRSDESDIRSEALKVCVKYYNEARLTVQNLPYPVPNK